MFPKLLLLIFFCFGSLPSIYAQKLAYLPRVVALQSPSAKETKLKGALIKLQQHYGAEILFEDRIVDQVSILPQDLDFNRPLESNLKHVLSNTRLSFKKIRKKTYVILLPTAADDRRTEKEQSDVPSGVNKIVESEIVQNSQENNLVEKITGTVKDESGEPLPGVNILLKGSNTGTTTTLDGSFSMHVNREDAVLVFSFVGYLSQEVPVGTQETFEIVLKTDEKALEEVVVVGYGTQHKANITGAVGVIESKQLANRPVASVLEALQGQVPGLNVVRTGGQPGNQSINVQIRGASTFSANPVLTIVDGVPASLDRVNPNDIESISVLKDAASAAIYGSRATGGVILVTTKKGKSGKPSLNYSSSVSLQIPTRWPEKPAASEYARMHNLASINDGVAPRYSAADLERFDSPDWKDHDWDDYLLRNAFQTNQNLSISGGGDRHQYYLSVGYLKQNGIVLNSSYDRLNIQLNQDFKIGKKLELSVKGGISPSRTIAPAYAWSQLRFINATPKTEPYLSDDGRWLLEPTHTNGGNALATLSEDGGQQLTKGNRLNGTFTGKYNVTNDFNLSATYGIASTTSKNRRYQRILTVYDPVDPTKVAGRSADNFLNVDYASENFHNLNFLANYSRSIGGHQFSLLGGLTREWFESSNDQVGTRGFLTDDIYVLSAGSSNPEHWTISGTASDWALQSLIGRANYAFKEKYLVEAIARYDGSSRFAKGYKWGLFPSLSAGWIISNEAFLQHNPVISFLKVKGSWGRAGNQNVGFYPFANRLAQSTYFFNGAAQRAVTTSGAPNKLLTWETKEAVNIGFESGLFGNIMEVSLDVFSEKTRDILLQVPLPTTYGQAEPVQNAGRVDNRGWELELRHRKSFGKFSYAVAFQVSNARNKVINMGGESPMINGNTITEEGWSMNEWYGLKSSGLFQTAAEVAEHAYQNPQTSAGDIRYVDTNEDGEVNSRDRTRLGLSDPRFPFGIRINLTYKNLDLNIFGQGIAKHMVVTRPWESNTYRSYHLDYWTEENTSARFPKPRHGSGPEVGINKEFSSFWLENAAYFRFKNIELGYRIHHDSFNKIGITGLRAFISAENMLTFTRFLGYDPELATGLQTRQMESRYPVSKLLNVGVNFNF
jgi:TonB-linked SusC/RagA family outer membrane protein